MSNFAVEFTYPWLLLLLIPAFVFGLFPYFRLSKRYRRTRNRVTSVVLHLIVMTLSILALSGMTFSYDINNEQNEVILLVDVSDSGNEVAEARDDFVQDVILANDGSIKLGIVTFGYTQVYAVELTDNLNGTYNEYLRSLETNLPDCTATDISSALNYASTLFSNPQTAKIVLVSDGLETDGTAKSVVKAIAAKGIKVDTAQFSASYNEDEVQVVGVTLPEGNIKVGDEISINVSVQSAISTSGELSGNFLTIYDIYEGNEVAGSSVAFDLKQDIQEVAITHRFTLPGLHRMRFEITTQNGDVLNENNTYYSYYDLQVYDKILIIERTSNEASQLSTLLGIRDYDEITVVSVDDAEGLPATVDEMRLYDEVILMNVSNADMPAGLIDMLHSYVYTYGGGLFTIGGNTETGEVNLYNRQDLYNTLYQTMLPIEAVNYTPPLGVIFVIDTSGSMSQVLESARQAIISSLQAMTERDWCGVVSLSDSYSEEVQMLPMTQYAKILESVSSIGDATGGTLFSPAITYAGRALFNNSSISKRHIVLITDGMPSSSDEENYLAALEYAHNSYEVTTTIVTIGASSSAQAKMTAAAKAGQGDRNLQGENGVDYFYFNITASESDRLADILREDLSMPEIKDMVHEEFTPVIVNTASSVVSGISQKDMPTLGGFYGTKKKDDAEVILIGEYDVPIYAQWQFGAGMVGSFMCDLEASSWSAQFMASDTGQRIIANIIAALLPTSNIDPQDIDVTMTENNYSTQLNIYTEMEETQRIDVTVTSTDADGNVTVTPYSANAATGFSRLVLTIKEPGVHEILVEKKNEDGTVYSSLTVYKAFSYSAEYNYFINPEDGVTLLADLAESGNGIVVEDGDAASVYDTFIKALHLSYDPRLPMLITALVLFLLDIAVRKFKWKWIHEIIRERKQRRELEGR